MKKFWKKLGGLALGAALCAGAFCGEAQAAPDESAMAAFKEAVMTPAKTDTRIYREDILLFMPTMQGELDFIGKDANGKLRLSGTFELWANDSKGETTEVNIPFYVDQSKKDMKIYFNAGGQWMQYDSPSLAAVITDVLATPTQKDLEEEINMVKEVSVLQEDADRRTMLVKLDGNMIADSVKRYDEENPADKGTADDAKDQEQLMRYLDTGLRNADMWYTWTVDKNNWQSITISYNLSGLVQETAKAALNDSAVNWSEREKLSLEMLAFYSELKSYTTFLNPSERSRIDIPKEVLKAPVVEDIIDD